MAADEDGNDVSLVSIPVTGNVGYAPVGTALATETEGANPDYVLPVAFKKIGLATQDGGPEWTNEPDGDAIQFWQAGYSIPNGNATCELVVKAAESNAIVDELTNGKAPTANGYSVVDAGGNPLQYVIWVEEVFKNGRIRRRQGPLATVKSVKEDKSERGAVLGYEITFSLAFSPSLKGHFAQWWIDPVDPVA